VKGRKAAEQDDKLITGFEEFYAEPPLHPDEAEKEEEMYDVRLSVATYWPIRLP
jgi:Argonaute siRNA chaperone (ARC) complex subunit Arb1